MDGIGVADRSLVSEQARIGRVWADVGWSGNGQNVDTIERVERALRAKRDTAEQRKREEKKSQTMHLIIRQGVGQAGVAGPPPLYVIRLLLDSRFGQIKVPALPKKREEKPRQRRE